MPECTICLESVGLNASAVLQCSHAFHLECIVNWSNVNPVCPNCKQKVYKITYNGNIQKIAPKTSRNIEVEESSLIFCQVCTLECNLRNQLQDFLPCSDNCGEHVHKRCCGDALRSRWLCENCSDLKERRRQEQIVRSQMDLKLKKKPSTFISSVDGNIAKVEAYNTDSQLAIIDESDINTTPTTPLPNQAIWTQYYQVLSRVSASSNSIKPATSQVATSGPNNNSSSSNSASSSSSSSNAAHNDKIRWTIGKHSPAGGPAIAARATVNSASNSNGSSSSSNGNRGSNSQNRSNASVANSYKSSAVPQGKSALKPLSIESTVIDLDAHDDSVEDDNGDGEAFVFKLPARGEVIRSEFCRASIMSVLEKKRKPKSALAESIKRELKAKHS